MSSKSLRILVVEDESLIANGILCCLKELGHTSVGIASDGLQALDLVEKTLPDLILMDINIPQLDGITVMEKVSQKHEIPCIFITGYSSQDFVSRASLTNSYGYLIKPVDINDLRAAIKVAMTRFEEFQKANASFLSAKQELENRKLIERAKGILMDTYLMKEAQAMQFLQKKSRETNKKINVLAQEIIIAERLINKQGHDIK